jgi:hypothetical protein
MPIFTNSSQYEPVVKIIFISSLYCELMVKNITNDFKKIAVKKVLVETVSAVV